MPKFQVIYKLKGEVLPTYTEFDAVSAEAAEEHIEMQFPGQVESIEITELPDEASDN